MNWNRIRYSVWAPLYDGVLAVAGFDDLRRRSIERLGLRDGDRVLIVGAGTGLDLPFLPRGVDVTATDVTPAMLARLEARAGGNVKAIVMDARQLDFPDRSFDAVVMHLIVAVMPDPQRGLAEAARVLKDGGKIAVFDKFVRAGARVPLFRRLANLVARPLFSNINRELEPLLAGLPLKIVRDEPVAFGGMFRIVTLTRTVSP